MQTIALLRVLLSESSDVARDGAQFQSGSARRMPGLEGHAAGILGQHLSVGGSVLPRHSVTAKPCTTLGFSTATSIPEAACNARARSRL